MYAATIFIAAPSSLSKLGRRQLSNFLHHIVISYLTPFLSFQRRFSNDQQTYLQTRQTSSLYSPGYVNKITKQVGHRMRKGLSETTPSKLDIRDNKSRVSDWFKAEAKSDATEAPSFGAFGSLLMDAAKDAQSERDVIHARRVERQEHVLQEKLNRKQEEESKRVAAMLEEEENDKQLAARLLQEEREYEKLEEERRIAQDKKDAALAKMKEEE